MLWHLLLRRLYYAILSLSGLIFMKQRPVYLVITPYFPSPSLWRCAFVYDQVRALQKVGTRYDVRVVNTEVAEDYTYGGVQVIACPRLRRGAGLWPWYYEQRNGRKLLRTLEAHQIDVQTIAVVHTHQIQTVCFANFLKRVNPALMAMAQFHDADPYAMLICARGDWFGVKRRLYFRYYRRAAERLDRCIAVSEKVKAMLETFPQHRVYGHYAPMCRVAARLSNCRPARLRAVEVLYNGVDVAQFHADAAVAASPRKAHTPFCIGTIGNFVPAKDFLTLFRALQLLRDRLGAWELHVIGSGETLPECRRFLAENGLEQQVHFFPERAHEALPAFYHTLDLFVLPSAFEGFGCVLAEAAACGVPFVACHGQGFEEVVHAIDRAEGKTALAETALCPPHAPELLAERLLYAYEHFAEVCAEGEAFGRKLRRALDIEVLVGRFLATLPSPPDGD